MNNKGLMRFEVLTMLFIMIVAFCGGAYFILKGADKQKINTMGSNGLRLSEVVVTNIDSFKNLNTVYLEEVINEELLKFIKNPFGKGNCDATQSRVDLKSGKAYTTLRCGEYLIDKENIKDVNKVQIYKISEWTDKKLTGENVEEKTFYNCVKDGENLYKDYVEEGYLVARINEDYNTSHYFLDNLKANCDEIVEKTYYRTKEKFN